MNSFLNTSSKLNEIRPILLKWMRLNRQYVKYWEGLDCGWWYNERTSTGFLAIAAWQSGEVSLEEFSTKKGSKSSDYVGRCDLYFTKSNHDFVVEAKHAWVNLNDNNIGFEEVKIKLDEACDDAKYAQDNVSHRIGIVFCVPKFKEPVLKNRNNLLVKWFQSLEVLKADAVCWVAPREAKELKGPDNFYYPGVAIIAKVVKHSK